MAKRKARAAGRPKVKKDEILRVRISAEQKQALITAAERDGLELSTWVRQVALRAAGALPGPTR
jgi:uncharacterized protein (DUF1778 family)